MMDFTQQVRCSNAIFEKIYVITRNDNGKTFNQSFCQPLKCVRIAPISSLLSEQQILAFKHCLATYKL